jgi:hypothetical protein
MPSDHIGCAAFLTRIATSNPGLPNMVVLRVGTLDKSNGAEPALHIWARRKQAWLTIDEAIPTFEVSPTPAEFAAAVSG